MTKTVYERMLAAQREGQIRRELQAEQQAEIERLKAEQANSPVVNGGFDPEVWTQLQLMAEANERRAALFDDIKAQAAAREAKKSTYTYRGALRFR